MTLPLTVKQERIWRYIQGCERSPTYSEITRDLGYRSRGELHRTIAELKRRGFLAVDAARARSFVALNPTYLAAYPTQALEEELKRRLAA